MARFRVPCTDQGLVAPVLGVSDEDRQVMLPSGTQALFTNRVAWAITHMTQAGSAGPARAGPLSPDRARAKGPAEHPDRVDMTVLSQFPEYQQFRARKSEKQLEKSVAVVADEVSPTSPSARLSKNPTTSLRRNCSTASWRSPRRSWRHCRSSCCVRWVRRSGVAARPHREAR